MTAGHYWTSIQTLHIVCFCTALFLVFSAMYITLLDCHTLIWISLHCFPLTSLHCAVLHCCALHYNALHCTALHCTTMHCIALLFKCNAMYYTIINTSRCIALHPATLQCTSIVIAQNNQHCKAVIRRQQTCRIHIYFLARHSHKANLQISQSQKALKPCKKIPDYQVVFQAKQAYMGQKDQDGYDAEKVHFFHLWSLSTPI